MYRQCECDAVISYSNKERERVLKENQADKFDPFESRRSFANEHDRDTNKLKYYIGR